MVTRVLCRNFAYILTTTSRKTADKSCKYPLLEVGVRPLGLEHGALLLLDSGWQRKADLRVVHLLDDGAAGLAGGDGLDLDDLDGVRSCPVPRAHVAVAGGDGRAHGEVAVLTVHVVGTGTRVVPQPDAKVLDFQGLLLHDFFHTDNLAGSFLELPQLTQKVPKPSLRRYLLETHFKHLRLHFLPGFSNYGVRGKDPHAVKRSLGLFFSWKLASNDAEFPKRPLGFHFCSAKKK